MGDQRTQVVHLGCPRCGLRDRDRAQRSGRGYKDGTQQRVHRAGSTHRVSKSSATCRRWAAAAAIPKCVTPTCAFRKRTCSANAAPATNSARCGWDPARLAHCMRWLGSDRTGRSRCSVDRAQKRLFARLAARSEKQGIQWMMAESALRAVFVEADGAARGVQDRKQHGLPQPKCRWPNITSPTHCGKSVDRALAGARRAGLFQRHTAGAVMLYQRALGGASLTVRMRCT